MDAAAKRNVLWKMINDSNTIHAAGAYDAISARLIEDAGLQAIWAGSLGISCALGLPDVDVVTMSEFLAATAIINRSSNLPVIADCNCGYGDSNNITRLVYEYENAGIAGICIEDQAFPKKNSFYGGNYQIEDPLAFAEKIRTAKHIRKDPQFILIARIEALVAGLGHDDALKRAQLYKNAGADIIIIHSKDKNAENIKQFLGMWNNQSPVGIIPSTYNFPDNLLREFKVSLVIYANQILRTIIPAVRQMLPQITLDSEQIKVNVNELSDINEILNLHNAAGVNSKYKT